MIAAYIRHLRIDDRELYTGEVAKCFVFDWEVSVLKRHEWVDANAALREELKEAIPPMDRGWDSKEKRWSVKIEHRDLLARIFNNFDAEAEALEAQPALF